MKNPDRCLNVMGVTHCSSVDGPGLRTVVWFQGCTNHCPGCHNPDSWDTEKICNLYSPKELLEIAAPNKLEDGLTLSGGDPLCQKNLYTLSLFLQAYKFCYGNKNIWLYTGKVWEDFICPDMPYLHDSYSRTLYELLSSVDVVVDGPFKQELKSNDYIYRGSSNQRLIDCQASLYSEHGVVLFDPAQIKI